MLYALVCGVFVIRRVSAAVGKSEFGLCGVVGGMTVIATLSYAMRQMHSGIAVGEL